MLASRMERVLASSKRERTFSGASYKVRSQKDEPTRFVRRGNDLLGHDFAKITSISRHYLSPSEHEWNAMEKEIKAATFILSIENDCNDDDFVPYSDQTLFRATSFLQRLMIHAHSSSIVGIGVPQIGPADHGSIDLFWEKCDRTLLINFPAGESIANYYGKKPKSEISGRFDPSDARAELVFWLAD